MRSPNATGEVPGELVKMINGILYSKGDKVRLKLGKRIADVYDMLLDEKIATIEVIYTDYENNIYLAVTIDDDPAQQMQRELGMYLFFSADEVEHV